MRLRKMHFIITAIVWLFILSSCSKEDVEPDTTIEINTYQSYSIDILNNNEEIPCEGFIAIITSKPGILSITLDFRYEDGQQVSDYLDRNLGATHEYKSCRSINPIIAVDMTVVDNNGNTVNKMWVR